jgi:hypothetical protein
MSDNNFINTFQPDDANRQTHILHKKKCFHYREGARTKEREKKVVQTHCKVLRRVVIFVKKNTYFIVISEVFGFTQNFDEFLHILHRLLISFPSDFLQVQCYKLWSIDFDM